MISKLAPYVSPDYLAAMPETFGLLEGIIGQLNERGGLEAIRPHPTLWLRCFLLTPLSTVRVVLLGNEPYTDGSGNGLVYDSRRGTKVSPSLSVILRKIDEEYGSINTYNGDSYLSHLPGQGVLMLNRSLTSAANKKNAHRAIWKPFFDSFVRDLNKFDNVLWVLWGEALHDTNVTNVTHKVVKGPSPSPLAGTSFLEQPIFTTINNQLSEMGGDPIRW